MQNNISQNTEPLQSLNIADNDMVDEKLIKKFQEATNPNQIINSFLETIKQHKGNFANIQKCFKALTQYCEDEPYYQLIKNSIVKQIDIETLGISQNTTDITQLF